MDLWNNTSDEVDKIEQESLTVDQRIELAKVKAFLCIAAELDGILHHGIGQSNPGAVFGS